MRTHERDLALELALAVPAVGQPGQLVGQRLLGEPPVGVDERVVESLDAQRGREPRVQLGGIERRDHDVVCAVLERAEQRVAGRGEDDHRHGVVRQPVEQVERGLAQQDRVRPAGRDGGERLVTARHGVHGTVEPGDDDVVDRHGENGGRERSHLPRSNGRYGVNLTVMTSPSAIR